MDQSGCQFIGGPLGIELGVAISHNFSIFLDVQRRSSSGDLQRNSTNDIQRQI